VSKKILVVGDSMLDVRIDCEVTRISPEAPIPIYDVDHEQCYAGGAANVALNIKAMGGDVKLLTAVGEDVAGTSLLDILTGSDLAYQSCPVERTTTKTRLFVNNVVRARIDEDHILSEPEAERMTDALNDLFDEYDVIVFSDYGKGALRHVDAMLDACAYGRITLVDPKGSNWGKYENATYVKANAAEVEAVGMSQYRIPAEYGFANLIKTVSGAGSEIIGFNYRDDAQHVPPLPVQCVDPTGAGDSYLAALAVGLAEGLPLYDACLRGSVAGALATRHVGTAVITREELEECLPRLLNNTTQL